MKKTLFCIILFFCFVVASWGQGRNIVATNPNVSVYTYVGSLMKDKFSGSNIEKIEVEVFGGDVSGGGLSTTSYRVATRNTYLVNKEIKGGPSSGSRHSFRVYENSNKLDLVIETFGWADFSIRAWIVDRNPVAHEVECINYDPTGKTDVTDQFQTTVFLASSGNGYIGIGKENPTERLEVNGTIRAKEVKIEATNWPDFVFSRDYELPKLSEIETHIKEKQHLPNMPSAAEIEKEGVSVSKIQEKLLQKVEELTLYVIEQDKTIKEQGKYIEDLQKELKSIKEKNNTN